MADKNFKDRIVIFRELMASEVNNEENFEIFHGLLSDYYEQFESFCKKIIAEADIIEHVSCYYINNTLKFDINYKK